MISSGGGKGKTTSIGKDNLLLWGTKVWDNGEWITVFTGGRKTARAAGVHMRNGRGRVNYMMDVNGDGLVDIFCMQDRRKDNEVTPGILLINQGDRTWKEDPNMMEYTRALLITDADGDGIAQEIVLNRGFCYPQRDGPHTDPNYSELGNFTDDSTQFCSSRPVGTNAVFKFNSKTQNMEEISEKFLNFGPEEGRQPACCSHNNFSGENDCHAKSIASGDFDGDQLADHIFLYDSKMVFYFSKDRPQGTLPDNPQYIGVEISIPCTAEALHVVDLDNDGNEEILIMCREPANFLVYSKGFNETDWTLENGCNAKGSLGAITDISLASFTEEDLMSACRQDASEWEVFADACNQWEGNGKLELKSAGITLVDLNNDGFLDAIVSYNVGYTRFFQNTPSKQNDVRNRFIAIKLYGEVQIDNKYGIGATVILHTKRAGKEYTQFREVTSYQHTSDKYGYKDDRIIFGLGTNYRPTSIVIRWSNGNIQTRKLQQHSDYTKWILYEIKQRIPTEQPSQNPSISKTPTHPTHLPSSYPTDSSRPSVYQVPTVSCFDKSGEIDIGWYQDEDGNWEKMKTCRWLHIAAPDDVKSSKCENSKVRNHCYKTCTG